MQQNMTLDWYAQHFWIPSLRYSGQGYQYQLWKYFLECFVGNIWDHAKWRKAIQKFMCLILLKCICWMTVKIWFSCNASWYLISGNPLFGELSENHHDLASTERSPNCFEIPILLLHSTCLGGRYPAAIVIPQFKRYSEISLATSTISRLWMSVLLVLLLITLEY